MMEETLRLILAELQAIRRAVDADARREAIMAGLQDAVDAARRRVTSEPARGYRSQG